MKYFLLCLLSISLAQYGYSDEPNKKDVPQGNRHILDFTVSTFENNQYESLPNTASESIVKKLSEKNNKTSFNVPIKYTSDKTAKSFFGTLNQIERQIETNDEICIYMSSHGVEVIGTKLDIKNKGEILYIVTDEKKEDWIPLSTIIKILSKPKFKKAKKLIILDTCRAYDLNTADDQVIGKNWQEYASKTEGYNESDADLIKYQKGDLSANLNLAIMYACESGMKSYFLDKNAFFSDSLNRALSSDKIGIYSLRTIFENTKSMTIWETRIKKGQRQEPVMIVYSGATQEGSKTNNLVDDWFFGTTPSPEESEELKKFIENIGSYQAKVKDKLGGTVVDLNEIKKFIGDLESIKKDLKEILDPTLAKDIVNLGNRYAKTDADRKKVGENLEFSDRIVGIIDLIKTQGDRILLSKEEKAEKLYDISKDWRLLIDNINHKRDQILKFLAKVEDLNEKYGKDHNILIDFLKEIERLRELATD
jgi:hypothetical protein